MWEDLHHGTGCQGGISLDTGERDGGDEVGKNGSIGITILECIKILCRLLLFMGTSVRK